MNNEFYKVILLLNRLSVIDENNNKHYRLIAQAVSWSRMSDNLTIEQLKLWQKYRSGVI